MKEDQIFLNKYVSIIHRISHIFFDGELAQYSIGCGQQFFLLRIAETPGVSILELAAKGSFDKGTTARAVKKLAQCGYVRVEEDANDRRYHKLFVTDKAEPVIKKTKATLVNWHQILTGEMTIEEKQAAGQLLEKMADNAYHYLNQTKRRDGTNGTTENRTEESARNGTNRETAR